MCDGIVIDLSGMRAVTVASNETAQVSGGARAVDVLGAADPLGLAAVTGTVGAVGMAGLTLGGGYGPLIGRFGLALDNLEANKRYAAPCFTKRALPLHCYLTAPKTTVLDAVLKFVLERWRSCNILKSLIIGAPEEIRTPDPQIRSLVLYPAELRALASPQGPVPRALSDGGL